METYLDFKNASCKDCYKCLRACPVKAIEVTQRQAKIATDRCILCGKCTEVCPQNAKHIRSEIDKVKVLLSSGKVVASVAPSFISSFSLKSFNTMKTALKKLGFFDAEETAIGAKIVVSEYDRLLRTGDYDNFITSSCPAVNKMIQIYFPKALDYLAPVVSPMLAHAKMLKAQDKDAKIVFIGPCIAKKREARESGLVDAVLTFEELSEMLSDKEISFSEENIAIQNLENESVKGFKVQSAPNRAKFFPVSRGIIKSFSSLPEGYEYIAVDGAEKCRDVLEGVHKLKGIFLELNACEYACVNGPCALLNSNCGPIRANAEVRKYVAEELKAKDFVSSNLSEDENNSYFKSANVSLKPSELYIPFPRIRDTSFSVPEKVIEEILAKTGKKTKDDELNCGACGYSTCREKAWAVANGYAELEMCLPYMRQRAETMSYEIIQNSPNGIVMMDYDLKILEINSKAKALLGVKYEEPEGKYLVDYYSPEDFFTAILQDKNIHRKKVFIDKTARYAELSIHLLKEHKAVFAVMKDITEEVSYDQKLQSVKLETLMTTDAVIKKQMRVAQEIASLLGETTAETKVALINLKKTLTEADKPDGES